MKEEAEKKARTHEVAIADIQIKDRIIAEYCSKKKRCSRALKVIQNVGTSPDVMIEIIRDLLDDIIN